MFRKTLLLLLVLSLALPALPAALAAGAGVFAELSRNEGADGRLALLEEAAEPVAVSVSTDRCTVEVSQACYEGDRIFIAYRVTGTGFMIHDGLYLEDGSYADILAGEELEQENGSVIGWKECVLPEGRPRDTETFSLVFGSSDAERVTFTVNRRDCSQVLRGASASARAELVPGSVDIKGTVTLTSPEQAASWIAWQEGAEETGTDVIACWNLWRNGEPVSGDLYGASQVVGTDEVVFEVMFPVTDDLTGLSLVPEYSEAGEKPEEAIRLEPAAPEE